MHAVAEMAKMRTSSAQRRAQPDMSGQRSACEAQLQEDNVTVTVEIRFILSGLAELLG
jgi:hypothetical protein